MPVGRPRFSTRPDWPAHVLRRGECPHCQSGIPTKATFQCPKCKTGVGANAPSCPNCKTQHFRDALRGNGEAVDINDLARGEQAASGRAEAGKRVAREPPLRHRREIPGSGARSGAVGVEQGRSLAGLVPAHAAVKSGEFEPDLPRQRHFHRRAYGAALQHRDGRNRPQNATFEASRDRDASFHPDGKALPENRGGAEQKKNGPLAGWFHGPAAETPERRLSTTVKRHRPMPARRWVRGCYLKTWWFP